jgi:hypothetical protein
MGYIKEGFMTAVLLLCLVRVNYTHQFTKYALLHRSLGGKNSFDGRTWKP